MARDSNSSAQIGQLIAAFMKLPTSTKVILGVLALAAGGVFYALTRVPALPQSPPAPAGEFPEGSRTVVICHWNMENLFDDRDDKRRTVDEPYDAWFVTDPASRQQKYQRLTEALLKLNGGIGPDIIVGNEIESPRAAELLQQALNANLPASAPKYDYVAMKEIDVGRHIAPCVISRFPLSGAKLLTRQQRILLVHVEVNKHDLTLVASHWTSQLTDKGDKEGVGRDKYAALIHDAYAQAFHANPAVDWLVCGDFNDAPEADSVVNKLHMTGDAKLVTTTASPPLMYGLLSGKDPAQFGTHYYNKPLIYDHFGVSPGLLDNSGWGYVQNSVQVPIDGLTRSAKRQPWRFGTKGDNAVGRGYSDHFPVVATFQVAP